MDPILAQANPHVEPLAALTAPMETTKVDQMIYFRCTTQHTSLIRKDGKKLTFINHYYKTDIKEDIEHIRDHIRTDPSKQFKECESVQELQLADHALDPAGATERRIRAQVRAELLAELAAEGKNPLSPEAAAEAQRNKDVAFAESQVNKVAGTSASSAALQKLADMRAAKQAGGVVVNNLTGTPAPVLTPVSTSDIAGAAAGSNGAGQGI